MWHTKIAFFREMQSWSHCYTVVSYQALFRLSVYKIPAVYLFGAKNLCFCTIRDFGSPTTLLSIRPVPFRFKDCFFHFYLNSNRIFCKQSVENLIRRRGLRRLIWFCTVCQCPIKRTLGFNGLTSEYDSSQRSCYTM